MDSALRGGIPRNKLAIIAARTAHGKTATATRLALNIALSERPVLLLWSEDEELEFDLRALSVLSGVSLEEVHGAYRGRRLDHIWGRVSDERKSRFRRHLRTRRYDRPSPVQIAEAIAECRSHETIILDHLGEVDWGRAGPKHEAIGDGLRHIREAALQAECLFVAMAQLNREWDRRKAVSEDPANVRPVLSDIENSGQIEQVARVCVIAEKRVEEGADNGEYLYHVFKPTIATAKVVWNGSTATPDNPEPVILKPYQDTDREDDDG